MRFNIGFRKFYRCITKEKSKNNSKFKISKIYLLKRRVGSQKVKLCRIIIKSNIKFV